MRHELVICTKDRPDEVRRCLDTVLPQTRLPDRVLVVDSSDSPATQHVVRTFVDAIPRVDYVRSEAGLTRQRNVALDALAAETDVVHFVDDDTLLDEDYLASILDVFERRPEAVGVGGRISNLPEHSPRLYRRLLLTDSSRQGALLPSGKNILCFNGSSVRPVDWLSGCCMSYRRSKLRGLRFDEMRGGNGIGEDVDFSARAARVGPLLWTPHAVLEHRQSQVNRYDAYQAARRGQRSRWKLARDGVGEVRQPAVLLAALGEASILGVKAVCYLSRSSWRGGLGILHGLVDVARGRSV